MSRLVLPSIAAATLAVGGCTSAAAPTGACGTAATPDATFAAPFTLDTGIAPSTIGSSYGQTSCPNQLLVEVDLTQEGFVGRDVFLSGRWSLVLPASPCDRRATMAVSAQDADGWQPWDTVEYVAQADGAICHAQAVSHSNAALSALGGTQVPASRSFRKVRVAINATEGSGRMKVAVNVIGDAV